ncbi:MAG TPA: hypothetical protein GXX57_07280 [Firmicutes bacterium]|nr:hypothetical protein [Bacillota bacterium]
MQWLLMGLLGLILIDLWRAIIGPTVLDRLVAINAISSKVSVIILLLAFIRGDYGFIDVAFVFMLCSFVGSLWILRVLTPKDWQIKLPQLSDYPEEGEVGVSHD